jgi:hypothetical protein
LPETGSWFPDVQPPFATNRAAIIALFRLIDASDDLVFARSSDDAAFDDAHAVLEATKAFVARTERLIDHPLGGHALEDARAMKLSSESSAAPDARHLGLSISMLGG